MTSGVVAKVNSGGQLGSCSRMSQKLEPTDGSPTNPDAPFHPRGPRFEGVSVLVTLHSRKTSNVTLPAKFSSLTFSLLSD
jgi:hypothetical protein